MISFGLVFDFLLMAYLLSLVDCHWSTDMHILF